jgi:GxxExxY protein
LNPIPKKRERYPIKEENVMKRFIDGALTKQIISAAITVHRELGPGFIESIYEEALCVELDYLGIQYERQKTVNIFYREKSIGEHRIDLLVEGTVVVELKAIKKLEDIHFSIVRSYMKAIKVETGLIFNFATMPLMIKRVARETRSLNQELRNS